MLVNGTKIFCKGANWVPCEPFPSDAAPEKYRRLLRLAAEQTGGQMKVDSRLGEGTTVTAAFDTASIDCPPLGDMPGTVSLLVQGAPEGLEITYTRSTPKGGFRFDTRQVREILGPDVPLSSPDVAMWVRDFVAENEAEIT